MSLLCVVLVLHRHRRQPRHRRDRHHPTGALAKITQVVFGVLAPGSVSTNLMTASMGSGVAIHAADLLTDLKSGYLPRARPRQQFLAQFFGVMAGSVFVVFAFQLLVPSWEVIGERYPPPAPSRGSPSPRCSRRASRASAQRGVLAAAGAILGVAMALPERILPPKVKRFMPSATGLGLAFTMPFSNALAMFVGAVSSPRPRAPLLEGAGRALAHPDQPGVLAGEGLMELLVASSAHPRPRRIAHRWCAACTAAARHPVSCAPSGLDRAKRAGERSWVVHGSHC